MFNLYGTLNLVEEHHLSSLIAENGNMYYAKYVCVKPY